MKIMLVDDEPFALRTLHEMIGGAKDGWTVAAAVGDGEEAISALRRADVDLVISDIRMPGMNGLELTRYINEHCSGVKTILLTGYEDFEYAREALRHGVSDYILKPCSFESLFASIGRIEREIRSNKSATEIARRRNRDVFEKRLDDLLFGLPYPYFDRGLVPPFRCIATFTCCLRDPDSVPEGWKDASTVYTAIKNVAEEWFGAYGDAYGVLQERHVAVVLFLKEHAPPFEGEAPFREFLGTIRSLLKLELLVGVGAPCVHLSELSARYRESIRAMDDARGGRSGTIAFLDSTREEPDREEGSHERTYERKKNHRVISRVLEKMQERLSDDISLKSLAEEVFLNPTYLGRIFKETTGESFSNRLIRMRIEKAAELLADPAIKVYEVCERVGYVDPAHFTHVFKKVVGVTPYEYKSKGVAKTQFLSASPPTFAR